MGAAQAAGAGRRHLLCYYGFREVPDVMLRLDKTVVLDVACPRTEKTCAKLVVRMYDDDFQGCPCWRADVVCACVDIEPC